MTQKTQIPCAFCADGLNYNVKSKTLYCADDECRFFLKAAAKVIWNGDLNTLEKDPTPTHTKAAKSSKKAHSKHQKSTTISRYDY